MTCLLTPIILFVTRLIMSSNIISGTQYSALRHRERLETDESFGGKRETALSFLQRFHLQVLATHQQHIYQVMTSSLLIADVIIVSC